MIKAACFFLHSIVANTCLLAFKLIFIDNLPLRTVHRVRTALRSQLDDQIVQSELRLHITDHSLVQFMFKSTTGPIMDMMFPYLVHKHKVLSVNYVLQRVQ